MTTNETEKAAHTPGPTHTTSECVARHCPEHPDGHTPGPWHIGADQDGYKVIHAAKDSELDGAWIAMTRNSEHSFMSINGEADARLIAAAPDLLAALTGAMETAVKNSTHFDKKTGDEFPWVAAARAAILRAKGGR